MHRLSIAAAIWSTTVSAAAFAGETLTYSYDVHGRLVSTAHSGSVNNGLKAAYRHDRADNRTNVTVSGSGRAGPASGATYVNTARTLYPGESLISEDGRFKLAAQSDGNLVIYSGGGAIWASNTGGRSMRVTLMQDDGNLVVYDASNRPIWASNTQGSGTQLFMQSDGNLVVYASTGAIWSSNTGGR